MGGHAKIGYYAVRLIRVPGSARPGSRREEIAAVEARDLREAIAVAMRRYPGYIAVHGERK